MNRSIPLLTAVGAFFASSLGSEPAVAHEREGLDEIQVIAPRGMERERLPLRRGEQVSMSYSVSLADLDLARADDRHEFERRVAGAAEEICERLARMYPVGEPNPRTCVQRAVADAMAQAEATGITEMVARTDTQTETRALADGPIAAAAAFGGGLGGGG